jgi:hypothetical protein
VEPVVALGAMKAGREAALEIPGKLGSSFWCNISQTISIPLDGDLEEMAETSYKQAAAIYVSTLRIGLVHAMAIEARIREKKSAVSLCCSPPYKDLQLLGSPIPHALAASGVKISQGELFKFASTNEDVKDWVKSIEKYAYLFFADSPPQLKDCLVKLACETVHSSLVPTDLSWHTMECLHSSAPLTLKNEIAKVCAYVCDRCLVMVMKDLSLEPTHTNIVVSPAVGSI